MHIAFTKDSYTHSIIGQMIIYIMWNVGIEFMLTYGLEVYSGSSSSVYTFRLISVYIIKKEMLYRHEKKTFLIGKWCEEYS